MGLCGGIGFERFACRIGGGFRKGLIQMILDKINLFGQRFSPVHKDMVFTVDPAYAPLELEPGSLQEIVMDLNPFFCGFCFERRTFPFKFGRCGLFFFLIFITGIGFPPVSAVGPTL
ncbi:MAG: hypothetical protein U5R49_20415 [Deltaproteobacteria bacterium]|nr:hypothetical protein [Deltaproteobacteria bacterium]